MKVGIKLGKVKKFGIGWCIPHRVVADNAKGGFVRTPPAPYRVNYKIKYDIDNYSPTFLTLLLPALVGISPLIVHHVTPAM